MTHDAYAPEPHTTTDHVSMSLSRLVSHLSADAIFALAAGGGLESLEGFGKRRGEAYVAVLSGTPVHTLLESIDGWIVESARAIAPIAPPVFLPMSEVLREKVTLEVGARGLRGLFSSKPSDKDLQRVKRYGYLATRALRSVLCADGELDQEERRTIAAFIGALGLPDEDASPLYAEAPIAPHQLDVYGDLEPAVTKAIMRGSWLAAAWDQIDPREESVVRTLATKLSVPAADIESTRNEAVARVDARRAAGLAAVDAVRFTLADRMNGIGSKLALAVGHLMLPKRYRDEALSHVEHWNKFQLSGRHKDLASEEKTTVLALAWAAALFEDPSVSRRAVCRARHDRVAQDMGTDGAQVRSEIEKWFADVLAPAAFQLTGEKK
ncbi:MAG: hypothetical protein U0174_25380 [Polyangiaceae bacterium]